MPVRIVTDGLWEGRAMTEPRVALVTGGARGIGAAVARRLPAQGSWTGGTSTRLWGYGGRGATGARPGAPPVRGVEGALTRRKRRRVGFDD